MKNLSIVVPVFNSEAFIKKCLNSLIRQDIPLCDYEILIINDGSTDNTVKIAESYAREYFNVKVISQPNSGIGGARNTGLSHATGKYLFFVDSDDYIEPNCLNSILELSISNKLDVLRFNHRIIYNGISLKKNKVNRKFSYNTQPIVILNGKEYLTKRVGWECFLWNYLFRTSFLKIEEFIFRPGIYFEDVEWLPRVLLKTQRVGITNNMIYNYVQREGSVTKGCGIKENEKIIQDRLTVIRLHKNLINSVKDKNFRKWINNFNSLAVLSIFSIVLKNFPNRINETFEEIQNINLIPLSCSLLKLKQKLIVCSFNLSPKLYLILIKTGQKLKRYIDEI